MVSSLGKVLLVSGLVLAGLGLLLMLGGRFLRFGHLPLDLHIERPNASFHFPLGTSLLLSLLLTLLLNLILRLRR